MSNEECRAKGGRKEGGRLSVGKDGEGERKRLSVRKDGEVWG